LPIRNFGMYAQNRIMHLKVHLHTLGRVCYVLVCSALVASCGGGGGSGSLQFAAPVTIALNSNKSALALGETATITFNLSAPSTNFGLASVKVSGGTLLALSGGGQSYIATFTPALGSTANGVVSVPSGAFSDATGTFNADGADANNTVTLEVNTVTPIVTEVFPDRLAYGLPVIFKISGSNLENGLKVTIDKCAGLVQMPGGSQTLKSLSCTPSGTGNISVIASDSTGYSLFNKVFTVPEPRVIFDTSMGKLTVQLNPTLAPVTVQNFLQYVSEGFYTDTMFHRIVQYSMQQPFSIVQGGGFSSAAQLKATRAPIVLEAGNGLSNSRGTIGMARTQVKDSATSGFYFNVSDNLAFNQLKAADGNFISDGYAVFGIIVDGLSVLDKLGAVSTDSNSVPLSKVLLNSVTRTQ